MTLARQVVWRNPFKLEIVPLIDSLHRLAYSPSQRLRQELPKIALRPFFSLAYRRGLGGRGAFSMRVKGAEKKLDFDGRNLQFAALYMPQYAHGYETETAALLDLLVGPESVFFDVGANWGYYALMLAAREGFEGKVHAFEPHPRAFRDLEDLVRQAGLERQIRCHQLGLSDKAGQGRLVIPDGMHGGTAKVAFSGGEAVVLACLDDLGLPAPAVIKMDVEDHELAALMGASKTLDRARPLIVFESGLSRQGAQAAGPFAFLEKKSYRFFHPAWDGGKKPRDGETAALTLVPFEAAQRGLFADLLNVLACPEEKIPELNSRMSA